MRGEFLIKNLSQKIYVSTKLWEWLYLIHNFTYTLQKIKCKVIKKITFYRQVLNLHKRRVFHGMIMECNGCHNYYLSSLLSMGFINEETNPRQKASLLRRECEQIEKVMHTNITVRPNLSINSILVEENKSLTWKKFNYSLTKLQACNKEHWLNLSKRKVSEPPCPALAFFISVRPFGSLLAQCWKHSL